MDIIVNLISIIGTIIGISADCKSLKNKKKISWAWTIAIIICVVILIVFNYERMKNSNSNKTNINNGIINNETIINKGIINEGTIINENNTSIEVYKKQNDKEIKFVVDIDNFDTEYSIALVNDIPYPTLYPNNYFLLNDIPLQMMNENDMSIKINAIYINVLSYKPGQGDIYSLEPGSGGEAEFQNFYGNISGKIGKQILWYNGTDGSKLGQIDKSKYLKLEANDIESCDLYLNCEDSGIYNMEIQIEYLLDGEERTYCSDSFERYLCSKDDNRKTIPYVNTFVLRQIQNYIGNDKIPSFYKKGIDNISSMNSSYIIDGFSLYDKLNWETFIACHYTFLNEQNGQLDILKYLQAVCTNIDNWSNDKNICIRESEINDYAVMIMNSNESISFPWPKKVDSTYGEFEIPFYSLYNENPYAEVTNIKREEENIILSGYVRNDTKGEKQFLCTLELPQSEKSSMNNYCNNYCLNSIIYYD